MFTRSYDGAGGGRRWRGQPDMPAMLSAMHAARGPLARRARYLAANNALAASGVEAWVSALVGTGIKPQSGHADPDIRAGLNLAFERWTDDADADGLTDFYGIQALMVRRMVIDGESFALLVNDAGGLRIRLIDAEQVDASLNREPAGGGRIVQGIEFDAAGRRVAYHVLPERPGMPFARLALTPRRVPAEDVVHLFRPETPGQVRGVSWFAPVILRLADLDSWRDADLLWLGAELETAAAVEREKWDAVDSRPKDAALYEEAGEAARQAGEIVDRIERTPAFTIEGLKVKGRALSWCYATDGSDLQDFPEGHSTDYRLARSILRDLANLNAEVVA